MEDLSQSALERLYNRMSANPLVTTVIFLALAFILAMQSKKVQMLFDKIFDPKRLLIVVLPTMVIIYFISSYPIIPIASVMLSIIIWTWTISPRLYRALPWTIHLASRLIFLIIFWMIFPLTLLYIFVLSNEYLFELRTTLGGVLAIFFISYLAATLVLVRKIQVKSKSIVLMRTFTGLREYYGPQEFWYWSPLPLLFKEEAKIPLNNIIVELTLQDISTATQYTIQDISINAICKISDPIRLFQSTLKKNKSRLETASSSRYLELMYWEDVTQKEVRHFIEIRIKTFARENIKSVLDMDELIGGCSRAVNSHEVNWTKTYGIEFVSFDIPQIAHNASYILELEAVHLHNCMNILDIGRMHKKIAVDHIDSPLGSLLRSFQHISNDTFNALRQETKLNQRLALKDIEGRVEKFGRELAQSPNLYGRRLQQVAEHWRKVLADHIVEISREVERRNEIDNPYITGQPITVQQEIFVGRTDIAAKLERIMFSGHRQPVLLYGQRRMGKTSLLNNLGRLLPSTIVPLFVDLQGPASRSNDHAGMLYYIGRGMAESATYYRNLQLPPLLREALERDPFGIFDEWLVAVKHVLGESSGLLMLDEFEALESAISRGHFDEDSVLGTLRHIIQHHPRFRILLAGSHTLDEFRRWASYLINVQIVQISYLQDTETLQLIEHPVKDFTLRYVPEASQRVLFLTRGHPFLVQLLCAEVVVLKNNQDPTVRRLAQLKDVEAALPEALASGKMFFVDVAQNQVDARGLKLLRRLAANGEAIPIKREALALLLQEPDLDVVLRQLIQRDLIEAVDGGYRFQVEMIRQWFAQESGTL